MKKTIGKMNKAELYEFVKELKDVIKGKNLNLAMLEGESQGKDIVISKHLETIRTLRSENSVMKDAILSLQHLLSRHKINLEGVKEEIPFPPRKSRGWRNLFGLFS